MATQSADSIPASPVVLIQPKDVISAEVCETAAQFGSLTVPAAGNRSHATDLRRLHGRNGL